MSENILRVVDIIILGSWFLYCQKWEHKILVASRSHGYSNNLIVPNLNSVAIIEI